MYLVSRNPSYDSYYMSTRQGFDHLVDRCTTWRNGRAFLTEYPETSNGDRWTLNWTSPSQPGVAQKLRGPTPFLEYEGSPAMGMSSVGILCFFCQEPHYICYSRPRAFLSVLLFKNCCSVLIFSFIFRRLLHAVQGPLHLRQVEKLARPSPVCKQGRAYSARLRANLPLLRSKKRQEQDGEEASRPYHRCWAGTPGNSRQRTQPRTSLLLTCPTSNSSNSRSNSRSNRISPPLPGPPRCPAQVAAGQAT